MSLYTEEREDGTYAFYMEGDLQFDSRDEAIYHESLVLPALTLSKSLMAEGRNILICGGGDGLALRECLRFPNVARVDLVDIDESVIEMGRTRFAESNRHAFDDPRAHVTIGDAWDFLASTSLYDAIFCDFTVPRRPEETRIFTQEWYRRLRSSLTPDGMLGLNTVSPERTPEAFFCLKKTVRSAGLYPVPYRVCIPSYREQGYGAWGFILASPRPIGRAHLRGLKCPVETEQADISRLWRGATFTRKDHRIENKAPLHTLENSCLLTLLLNPARDTTVLPAPPNEEMEPYALDSLLHSIPIQHPYHTREMVEAVADSVIGSIRSLDIPRLVDALLERAAQLPKDLITELERLREFLRLHLTLLETFGRWCYRLFAVLVVIMTLANVIAPDNAFGKGSFGIGRASVSRGFSSSYSVRGGSSFGGQRSVGGSFGAAGSFRPPPARITSTGFRSTYRGSGVTDIYGNPYRSRVFNYYDEPDVYITVRGDSFSVGRGGVAHSSQGALGSTAAPKETKALFVADDDLMVLENGDVVVTLSDDGYLLLKKGRAYLMSQKQPAPLMEMLADSELFLRVSQQLQEQSASAHYEREAHGSWLGWASWTRSLFPTVQGDIKESQNLQDLEARLVNALQRVGKPPPTKPVPLEPGTIELFSGAFLLPNRTVALRKANGEWQYTDGKMWWTDKTSDKHEPCPALLQGLLRGIATKLMMEIDADIKADQNYLMELSQEHASLVRDLMEYTYFSNNLDSSYEVDYGTDQMSADQAISRTQQEIAVNDSESAKTHTEIEKWQKEKSTLLDFHF